MITYPWENKTPAHIIKTGQSFMQAMKYITYSFSTPPPLPPPPRPDSSKALQTFK